MRIRSALEADVPAIMAIYRPYVEKSAVSFETVMPDQAAFTQRFQQITAVYPWLVVEDEQGRMLGMPMLHGPLRAPRMTGSSIWPSIFAWTAIIMAWHGRCMRR